VSDVKEDEGVCGHNINKQREDARPCSCFI
jgi:hypothetical protein